MLSMDKLYRAHANMIYRYLLALSGDAHTAEELTQETFIRLSAALNAMTGAAKRQHGSARSQRTYIRHGNAGTGGKLRCRKGKSPV